MTMTSTLSAWADPRPIAGRAAGPVLDLWDDLLGTTGDLASGRGLGIPADALAPPFIG